MGDDYSGYDSDYLSDSTSGGPVGEALTVPSHATETGDHGGSSALDMIQTVSRSGVSLANTILNPITGKKNVGRTTAPASVFQEPGTWMIVAVLGAVGIYMIVR